MHLAERLHLSRLPRRRTREPSLEDRNIRYFTIDTALQGLVMGGIFGFISVFIVRLGASNLLVSLVTSLPAIVLALSSIPAGQIVQRQRDLVRYTNVVRIFHRGSFLLIALLPWFVHKHLAIIILLIWAAKSVAAALLESSWMVVVADLIPPARRSIVNATRWAILSVVTAISTAVFGLILDRVAFPLNYQIVFLASFAGGAAGMVFFGKIKLPQSAAAPLVESQSPRGPLWQRARAYAAAMNVPSFVRYELAATVLRLGLNMPAALYSVFWIRELRASDLWIGWQATAGKLALIAGYVLWGRLISRKGYRAALLTCTTALGLYPILTGLVPSQLWLPLVAIVQGFFSTGIDISFFDTLLSVAPSDRRPPFIALNTFLASATVFVAPLIGSLLADHLSIRSVFFIAGGIHIVAALLFWKLRIATS